MFHQTLKTRIGPNLVGFGRSRFIGIILNEVKSKDHNAILTKGPDCKYRK